MLTIAHLSDLHLNPLTGVTPGPLISKRGLGYLNWLRKRHRVHDPAVLGAVLADIAAAGPDHIVVTGDVSHIGLPGEFTRAAAMLDALGPRERVSFVPGNHDAYVPSAVSAFTDTLAPWMSGDDGAPGFPWLRRRQGVALIGVSSGVPTWPFAATGRVGAEQIERTAMLLHYARGLGLARVVLIHHPPCVGAAPRLRWLSDAAAFEAMLAECGAELVLHGHHHVWSHLERPGLERPVPVLGVPSASMRWGEHEDPAGWQMIRIAPAEHGPPAIEVVRRGLTADGGMAETGRFAL